MDKITVSERDPAMGDVLKAAMQIVEIKRQRDELLEAAELYMAGHPCPACGKCPTNEAMLAAIAKARG